jgi:amphi-Trp domain-containing protein
MTMEKKKISLEQRLEYSAVVSYLENLLDAFKTGSIEVRKGEHRIVLTPASEVNVAVDAKQKPGKESFSMEISWQHSQECKDGEEFCIAAGAAEQPGNEAKNGPTQAQANTSAAGATSPVHDAEKKQADATTPADGKNKKIL